MVISGSGLNGSEVSVYFTALSHIPRLDIKVSSTYPRDTKVAREALIVQFDLPVNEVFRKNGVMDTENFSPEYCLNRQGVKFGRGERQAMIYHTPGVSSLQLDYEKNTLLINLEYCKDHPKIMAHKRDNGDLMITTIKDLLAYLIQTENIYFQYFKDGIIKVYNSNNNAIKGLSMAVRHSDVLVDGAIPESRTRGEDRIFWFDVPANDTVIITLLPGAGSAVRLRLP